MSYTELKYQADPSDNSSMIGVHCKINNEQTYVRIGEDSRVWLDIKEQVEEGTLTIAEAD
jgi:hypothetical protein|tara:strand:- start:39 stop:218 length:180 start_codon:yes stop_codon:yes gene_type:complete